MQTSVIIPTFQASQQLPSLIDSLGKQSLPPDEIIIVDSSSRDSTVPLALERGCIVHTIEQCQFRHGYARNLGARLSHGAIMVFLTQDVLPANDNFLVELVRPIRSGIVSAAFGRQLPNNTANPIEAFARHYNYPPVSSIRTAQDISTLGVKAAFFSDSASAVQKQVFWQIGGFSEDVIVNEDMDLCARLLETGCAVAYQAQSCVFHSHNYRIGQLFKRYFDIGVFFATTSKHSFFSTTNREGKRFVVEALKHLVSTGQWRWIPRLTLETGVKLTGFRLGVNYRCFPRWLNFRLSGQSYFWQQS